MFGTVVRRDGTRGGERLVDEDVGRRDQVRRPERAIALVEEGLLGAAVCVGVRSDETPQQLEEGADVLVDGPLGVRGLLMALAS